MSRKLVLLLVLMPLLQLTACSNAARWESSPTATMVYKYGNASSSSHADAAAIATQQIGRPYKWGGTTPKGFDCSGLVKYSYNKAGMSVPRTSRAQYSAARHVSLREARTGDLLFFRFNGKISHVGIYLGDGRFVHSPSSGKHVEVASLQQPTYNKAFVTAGQVGAMAAR